jgi:3-polyprenyl-4-hydroxybenzoate decarboxylase
MVIRIDKRAGGDGLRVIKAIGGLAEAIGLPAWTIVVGADADAANLDDALFHWLAHMSPERDRAVSVCGRRMAFDSTPKMPGDEVHGWPVREWPPLLRMPEGVRARVREIAADLSRRA